VNAGSTPFKFDNSFAQENRSMTLGFDFGRLSVGAGEWVVGAMFGYAQAKIEYATIVNDAKLEGGHVGLYSGFTAGGFFNDLVVNAAWLELDNDAPSLNLVADAVCDPSSVRCIVTPADRPILSTPTRTFGGQMETGWRFGFGPAYAEPLATLSWLQTELDPMRVPADDPVRIGGTVEFETSRSIRGGLGVRMGMDDVAPTFMPLAVSITARSVQEWDGEATVSVANIGPDTLAVRNVLDGAFNELNAGVSLGDGSEHLGAFLNVGGVWGEDYEAKTGSLGVRLKW
jgi:uncharacterized protein with beta-barrel porin domain